MAFQNSSACPFLSDLNNVSSAVSSPHSLPWQWIFSNCGSLTILRSWERTVSESCSEGDTVPCWVTCELLTGYPLPYTLLAIVSTRQSILTTDIHQWDLFQIAPISSLIKLLQSATMIKRTVTNMCCQLGTKLAGCWTSSSEKEGETPQSHAGSLYNLFVTAENCIVSRFPRSSSSSTGSFYM